MTRPGNDRPTAGSGALCSIRVLSTNAMRAALRELVPAFERARACHVELDYCTTATLTKRLADGETADAVILAADAMDALVAEGRIAPGARADLARTGMGAAVRADAPRPDVRTVDAFVRTLLGARSVVYTTTGASGIHFAGLLDRLGIAERVNRTATVIPGGLVGEVLARGEADVGVQMISEILAVEGVELAGPLPPELQKTILFSTGRLAASRSPDATQALIEFLASPGAGGVMKRRGLDPVAS